MALAFEKPRFSECLAPSVQGIQTRLMAILLHAVVRTELNLPSHAPPRYPWIGILANEPLGSLGSVQHFPNELLQELGSSKDRKTQRLVRLG